MPEARFFHTFTPRGPQSAGPAGLPQSANPESSLTRDLPFVRLNAEFQPPEPLPDVLLSVEPHVQPKSTLAERKH